jgi:hypothetical protein
MELTPQEQKSLEVRLTLVEARDEVRNLTARLAGSLGRLNRLATEGADTERELAAVERAYSTLSDDVLVGLQRAVQR